MRTISAISPAFSPSVCYRQPASGEALDTDEHDVALSVNGIKYQRRVESRMLLSDFIRHELSLAGTHVGCEHGVCGTCTVLVDGAATRSCLCLAVQADGLSVETVESLGKVGALNPL